MKRAVLFVAVAASGCVPKSDPRWQLDHDRVVAARATPPHLPAGATTTIDGLVAHAGADVTTESPVVVTASPDNPPQLAVTIAMTSAGWQVTAPSDAVLDQVRSVEQLDPGAPVPLTLNESFGPIPLLVSHTIFLGDSSDNPQLGAVTIGGISVDAVDHIIIPTDTDVPLAVDADATAAVNWLTSCGTMHDDNEHAAFVHAKPDDPQQGQLVVVVRAADGGVTWQVWSIEAQ